MKRTYSESTALPNLPGVTSGSGVKRACSKSTALPNPPVVSSSASGLKRAHEKDTANDDEEQPGDTGPDFKFDCRSARCGCCRR